MEIEFYLLRFYRDSLQGLWRVSVCEVQRFDLDATWCVCSLSYTSRKLKLIFFG